MKLESILKPVKNTLVALGLVSLLGATAFNVNYFATHQNKVQVVETENGIEYSHPDKQTTHILNFLAGKEGLTEEEKEGVCKYVDESNNEFNHKKYSAFWKIEIETGSPKIEWIDYRKNFSSSVMTNAPSYNPFSNTVYISCDSKWLSQDDLLSELSHAKQYANNPVNFCVISADSLIRTIANMAIHDETFWSAYCREYSTWGSFEFEAHRIIEPQLKQRLAQ